MSVFVLVPLDTTGVLSQFEEFEVLLELSMSGQSEYGEKTKKKPNLKTLKTL